MKAYLAPPLLVITTLIQAMGLYPYHRDGITLAGQLLFPILFGLMALYLARKGRPGAFAAVHLGILVASALLLAASLAGMNLRIPQLYPTMIVYYIAFALVAVECALRIAGLPKKKRGPGPAGPPETSA